MAQNRDYVSRPRSPRSAPFLYLGGAEIRLQVAVGRIFDTMIGLMRFPFIAALVLTIAGASTFWYKDTAGICPAPITYRIGQLDSHFAISKEDAIAELKKSEEIWENHAGRELFTYDEEGVLVVDFVFDERQAMADSELTSRQTLDARKVEHEKLFATIDGLQKEYESRTNDYQKELSAYEGRLSTYNETVSRYNDQGGAPSEEFAKLERDKASLARESEALNAKSASLNEMAGKINQLGDEANKLVEAYNKEVEQYNDQFGYEREFTQGDYGGGKINIYKFSNREELHTVLVHEFGHALGIDHVEGGSSVMYYLLGDTTVTPELSSEDKEAFASVCGDGTGIEHTLRRFIRTTLIALNI